MINLSRFDLVSLRLFVAVVETGSLTAGAARFGISLAAASKRIVELEHDIGTVLLTRSKRGVSQTQAGQTLYRHAVKVVADLEQLAVAVGDFGRGVSSHVRLWANTSAVNGILPQVIARYLAQSPQTRIDLEESLSDAVVRAVGSGSADLGVFADNVPHGELQVDECAVDELVLLASPEHPLAGQALVRFVEALEYDFVGLERSASLMRLVSSVAEAHEMPLKVRVQVRSFDAMCRMVALGVGIGLLPRSAANPHIASMRLEAIGIPEAWARRRLLLGYRRLELLSPAARTLADMILAAGAATRDAAAPA